MLDIRTFPISLIVTLVSIIITSVIFNWMDTRHPRLPREGIIVEKKYSSVYFFVAIIILATSWILSYCITVDLVKIGIQSLGLYFFSMLIGPWDTSCQVTIHEATGALTHIGVEEARWGHLQLGDRFVMTNADAIL